MLSMSRRSDGKLCAWGSGLILFYFVLLYDTSVPTGYGGNRVHNVGLMQDRLIGVLVGVALLIAAAFLIASEPAPSAPTQPIPPQTAILPPTPPLGWTLDVHSAQHYPLPAKSLATTSRVLWERDLRFRTDLSRYSSRQLDWAYSNGVQPERFDEFVAFVESYRSYQKSITPMPWRSMLP
jgi:hypothetical protein